jgi:tRNA(Ile)-lysidine synthase
LIAESRELPGDWRAVWDGRHDLMLPSGLGWLRGRNGSGEGIASKYFEFEAAIVRGRTGGERIQPVQNRPVRSLKNMFQELAVPPWERERMPLVFFGERLAWVPGIGVAQEFRAEPGEQGIVPEWDRG